MSRALIFSRTTDYRHDSTERGAEVLAELLVADGHTSEHTEDPAVFTPEGLARFDLVVWHQCLGDVLDDAQREAFRAWLADGGAWAGVHGPTGAEEGWPEWRRIAGARFTGHPAFQTTTVHVVDPTHPSTAGLPQRWVWADEWYDFDGPLEADRTVLLTVDESAYEGATTGAGAAHPIAWCGPYGRGRTWYTALGHAVEAYDDPTFRAHLRGGLRSVVPRR